jgi:hypothetical protein
VKAEDNQVKRMPGKPEEHPQEEKGWSSSKKNVAIDIGYGFVKLLEG